ncbi:LOW QUALITY PROTEIN: protein moonraker [Tiliqua scincoides]|uniref:LOW QUALITY PROTEIN: protein moonraker n=1 Tax=Tiliqua scincoides TaxID=71010 RepID=UPI0034633FE4
MERGGAPQTQLRFSRKGPAPPAALARCASPRPVIIERLRQAGEPRGAGAGDGLSGGSLAFSAVSEEKLSRAVQLARRDVRRRQQEGPARRHLSRGEDPAEPGAAAAPAAPAAHPEPEATGSGAKVYLCAPPASDSPPTRDPGPGPHRGLQSKDERSALEVRRLQKELQSYVQKMEELARKAKKSEEILDPAEELRARVWRQEQAVRSARMLYVLQQQVKEIQEDLEKLSSKKIKHTKKSQAMARLAAAHRGTVRALQGFVTHLADPVKQQSASAHCRELGNLIRQLSLCSARLEADSSIPDAVVDLLLQIEDLEMLSKKGKKRPISASQVEPVAGSTRLPKREKVRVPEPQNPLVTRRLLPEKQDCTCLPLDERGTSGENLAPHNRFGPRSTAAAPESLPTVEYETAGHIRQQVLGRSRPGKMELGRGSAPLRKRGALAPRPQGSCRPFSSKAIPPLSKPVHFQESTVAFRLKETKPPLQETRSPRGAAQPPSPLSSSHRFPGRQAGRGPRSREPVPECQRTAEAGPAAPGRDTARWVRKWGTQLFGFWRSPELPTHFLTVRAAFQLLYPHFQIVVVLQGRRRRLPFHMGQPCAWFRRPAWGKGETETVTARQGVLSWRLEESSPGAALGSSVFVFGELAADEQVQRGVVVTLLFRAKGTSPARIAEEVEKAIRARLEPLLANAQKVNLSLERTIGLKEPLWENQPAPPQVGKAAVASVLGASTEGPAPERCRRAEQELSPALGLPDLDAMLQRMEEIEYSQEAVRQRYNQIVYSDLEFWTQVERRVEDASGGQEPQAPCPVQVTKLDGRKEPHVNIVLERPLDANAAEDLETEEQLGPGSRALQPTAGSHREGGTFLSVPRNVLQSICNYGARYEQHLQRLSHEEVGSFNPWHVAQSLAEELVEEAVGDVAAELQALCEDYAEAVFTSEFLQAAE